MKIDDAIIQRFLAEEDPETYKNSWIYSAVGRGHLFETPNVVHRDWVSKLYNKLKYQIINFSPRNIETVQGIFPHFNNIAANYTIMLVVGFPDPYDAMVLEHCGKEYMVFDLIQFGIDSLNEEYCCHRVLTHELIHMCIHAGYPKPAGLSYADNLNYITFDEGFAHALTYTEDITAFEFDDFIKGKYESSKVQLKSALSETDPAKQREYGISADTGDYWEKFASISGKLYLLEHLNELSVIYQRGWRNFAYKVAGMSSKCLDSGDIL